MDSARIHSVPAKARIFVNSGPQDGGAQKRRFKPESYTPAATMNESKSLTVVRSQSTKSPSPARSTLELSLAQAMLEAQYFDVFWASFLPNGRHFSLEAARHSTAGWGKLVPDLCQQSELVRMGLLANALGLLGRHSGHAPVIVEGWRCYGKTLQILAKSLPKMDEENWDKLLVASMLLSQSNVRLPMFSHRAAWRKIANLHPIR